MKLGIRTKMLMGIMVPVLLVLLLSGVLISMSVGSYAKSQAREKLASDSKSAANEVDTFFTGHLKAVEQSAQEALVIGFMRDLTSRPWFECTRTKKPVMTEPYIDVNTGLPIVTAAAPVVDQDD